MEKSSCVRGKKSKLVVKGMKLGSERYEKTKKQQIDVKMHLCFLWCH